MSLALIGGVADALRVILAGCMKAKLLAVVLAAGVAVAAHSQVVQLKPGLSGLSFLVGDWSGGRGKVADTGETSTGSSSITAEVGGSVLLRRDHTSLFDASGKPVGGFDQIMMIYLEGGSLHAEYSDGTHVIHYTSAEVQPGHAAIFTSATQAGAPTYRLAYELSAPTLLAVSFSMAPPGSAEFRPIANGSLTKVR